MVIYRKIKCGKGLIDLVQEVAKMKKITFLTVQLITEKRKLKYKGV